MAASKTYNTRTNYRSLSSDRDARMASESSEFEFDESDVWNTARSATPDFRNQATNARLSKKTSARRVDSVERASAGMTPASFPVNIPDWSKILKEDCRDNQRRENDDNFGEEDGEDGENRIPPHEFLARQFARTRIASYSLHEGIGRTLKGRDLSRVRNAIWEKIGFQD
ncbi:unnamed protein product [Ilex paraguariensis]|uniref:Senescence regulator n=1 Tax=Ilex paraguariensis TaxID=185542 RepID=A0ABC8RXN1_9AQUA